MLPQVKANTTRLDPKITALIRIAAQTARGDLQSLNTELQAGLSQGLTVNQIKESLIHIYAYAGFPRSIRGLQTFMSLLEEREAQGIVDIQGPVATEISTDQNRYTRGKLILEQLTGVMQTQPNVGYAAFAPEIERFLKEHLFADIFERDVLSYIEREFITISVLSSIGTVEPMLKSHLQICLHLGVSEEQLREFVQVLADTLGEAEASAATAVLNEVLS